MSQNPYEFQPAKPVPPKFGGGSPEFQFNYMRSLSFLFESPNGFLNLLLCSLFQLIPIIGPMVIMGYQAEILVAMAYQGGRGIYPDFQTAKFSSYLSRGVLNFLLGLLGGLVLAPLFVLVYLGTIFGIGMLSLDQNPNPVFLVLFFVIMGLINTVIILGLNLLLVPMIIKLSLTGDFGQAFDFRFIGDFFRLVRNELLLGTLLIMVLTPFLVFLGFLVVCVGYLFALALISQAVGFLHTQLYLLYLSRGGTPIPIRPLS